MSAPPILSVLLTSHLAEDKIEEILASFLDFRLTTCEVIYVTDSDGADLVRKLQSNVETDSNGTRFRLLAHNEHRNRAQSLNHALSASKGSYFWAPERAERPNKIVLQECLRRMTTDPAGCWILDRTLPESTSDWIEELYNGTLPRDERFLFNRSSLPSPTLYFRDGHAPYTAAELAWRVSRKKPCHTLDSFFIVDRSGAPTPEPALIQEMLFSLLRTTRGQSQRLPLLEELNRLSFGQNGKHELSTQLEQARLLTEQDPRSALDHVNDYLKEDPDNQEALKLKVVLLEKLRRHVEAAELKHALQKRAKPTSAETDERAKPTSSETDERLDQPTLFESPDSAESITDHPQNPTPSSESNADSENRTTEAPTEESTVSPGAASTSVHHPDDADAHITEKPQENTSMDLSIVIPTTGDGKGALQEVLLRLDSICDPESVELIIIDNASIDDTFDYLESLREKNFLNIKVITNTQNRGFAASVNQGLDIAEGRYILIQHNDLIPEKEMIDEMVSILDDEPAIGAVGPALDKCDRPEQTLEQLGEVTDRYLLADQIDSSCMLIRKSNNIRFNEAFGLAWFEDADYCNQLATRGLDIAISVRAHATHHHRVTTEAMGLRLEPELQWENADIYNARWHHSPELTIPIEGDFSDILASVQMPVNPLNPPGYWLDQIESLLTDERKTKIERSRLNEKDLINLIRILVVADKRDFLRQMESRMEDTGITPPLDLFKDLVRFYYNRNIYSRCRLYLDKPSARGPYFDLYRLRIAVKEKELGQAVERLNQLMERYPCHPDLYRLAGDIHLQSGDQQEADSFYTLARQLMPETEPDVEAFEIKY